MPDYGRALVTFEFWKARPCYGTLFELRRKTTCVDESIAARGAVHAVQLASQSLDDFRCVGGECELGGQSLERREHVGAGGFESLAQ